MYLELKDQINHLIRLEQKPKRIISLVPSQTELLYYLNLEEEVVGITKFCVHPETWFRTKKRVGGTKKVDFEAVKALKPDLIIANKEENLKSDIEQLQLDYQVYTSDIYNLSDACIMMKNIGQVFQKQDEVQSLIKVINNNFETLTQFENKTVLYLIWYKPYMAAGTATFINTMLNACGLTNIDQENLRYDEVTTEKIQQLNPDFIFLSSEPFPFKKVHQKELEDLIDSKVVLVDGEMFSWYGSRLLQFKSYWEDQLLPEISSSI